jgi:hypothetical protein
MLDLAASWLGMDRQGSSGYLQIIDAHSQHHRPHLQQRHLFTIPVPSIHSAVLHKLSIAVLKSFTLHSQIGLTHLGIGTPTSGATVLFLERRYACNQGALWRGL